MVLKKERPVVRLTPEMKVDLEKADDDLKDAERSIQAVESLGLDVTDLKDKIAWARKARETLLKEFS